MSISDVVRFAVSVLGESGVSYCIVGGVAVSVHGEPRLTRDVDFVIAISPDHVNKFIDFIEQKGLIVSRKQQVIAKLKAGRPAKIIFNNKLSFDLRVATLTVDRVAIEQAQRVKTPVGTFFVAPADTIVAYKLARFWPIDRGDIRKLQSVQGNRLNTDRAIRLFRRIVQETGIMSSEEAVQRISWLHSTQP